MRFQVPQFIEVEDKIFGPLTIKQFIYIAGAAGLSFVFFRVFNSLIIVIPLSIVVLGFSLALAFYQINNKPLIYIVQSAFGYFFSSRLYLWKKKDKSPEKAKQASLSVDQTPIYSPKLTQSRLHELTWSLDIKENLHPGTKDE